MAPQPATAQGRVQQAGTAVRTDEEPLVHILNFCQVESRVVCHFWVNTTDGTTSRSLVKHQVFVVAKEAAPLF